MTIKKYIADIYGNREGYKLHQLTESQIDLKIKFSKEFLDVVGKVDPGTTKVKQITQSDRDLTEMYSTNDFSRTDIQK